ncbi:MAG: hypothetical protein H6656_00665 [Ardenticatenaceae bacterium]|nr:hypothetical protein [Anaerolineales bacterium]MCB9005896.1 hypothetical protein [Ardenticatenaceae bacterium]
MSRFFTIFPDNDETTSAAADEVAPGSLHATSSTPPAAASEVPATARLEMVEARNTATTVDKALENLRRVLSGFLSNLPESNPAHTVSVVGVTERSLGLGNRRGMARSGAFNVISLKGGRLDVTVAFVLWADDLTAVEELMNTLQGMLLAASTDLWASGILRIEAEEAALADFVGGIDAWRKTAVYRILYEFHYEDGDGALSLIAKIPVEAQTDFGGETTVVTDRMVRWDNEGTTPLILKGRDEISQISILALMPETASGSVTVTRTFTGASEDPETFPEFAAFLTAVSGPNPIALHAQIVFPTLASFLAEFTPSGGPLTLDYLDENGDPVADWNKDNALDTYQAYERKLESSIQLAKSADRLEIVYQGNIDTVVYLQAKK